MAGKTKSFDCVAMKNRIQAELVEERKQLGEQEQLRRHHEWLKTSDDPLAVWWRSLKEVQTEAS